MDGQPVLAFTDNRYEAMELGMDSFFHGCLMFSILHNGIQEKFWSCG